MNASMTKVSRRCAALTLAAAAVGFWACGAFSGAAALATPGATTAAQASPTSICDLTVSQRIVAVGDVHGGYEPFIAILRTAGIIDGRQRWSGGRAILVQTGDVLDRGPDSRRVLDLLRRLERDAPRAGGRVHALLGNHEVMRILGDFRDVSAEEYKAFRSDNAEAIRESVYEKLVARATASAKATGQKFDEAAFRKTYLEQTPLGSIEMQIEFGPEGEYGRWLRTHETMVKINGIVFVHGGISPAIALLGCQAVNDAIRAELRAVATTATDPHALSNSETGPLWYRELALQNEGDFADEVDGILKALDARAMVIGHTVTNTGRIVPRFGGRIVQIDTGMLDGKFYPRGRPSALEIDGEKLTAIYLDSREALVKDFSRSIEATPWTVPPPSPAAGR